MSSNYNLVQGIEFVPIEKVIKRTRQHLHRNVVSIRRKNTGSSHVNIIRFSPDLADELSAFDSARIAKNTLTGELYFVLFKNGTGDVPFRVECTHSGQSKIKYPILQGKAVVNALLKQMNVPDGDVMMRVEISDNLSNSESYYTMMITKILK